MIKTKTKTKQILCCDFCEKTQDEVVTLVAGPNSVCICDECVDLCAGIVAEARAKKAAGGTEVGSQPDAKAA